MAGLWGSTDSFDGKGFFSSLGGAVNDLFAAQGKAAEAKNYGLAAELADKNAAFTEYSTGVKLAQSQRETYKALSGIEATVAGNGFQMGGSGLDILRDSEHQAALEHEFIQKQGDIQQEGFEEQAKSFRIMQKTAKEGVLGSQIAAGFKIAGAVLAL